MKKIDINQAVGILANVGVIAGIIFLAIELQQNNELMEAEARFNRLSISKEAYNIQSTNGELAAIIVKANNNELLSDVDTFRFDASMMRFFINMEWIFREMEVDSPERKYAEQQLRQALSHGLRRQIFLNRSDSFDPNFVRWIEDNILLP